MSTEMLKDFLLWSAVINYAVLFAWFAAFAFARGWTYRVHTRWFRLSPDAFDALNYGGVAVYKIGILLLNVVPLIALHVIA